MGTRRSRHNKGRKSLYKDLRDNTLTTAAVRDAAHEEADSIVRRGSRFMGGLWLNNNITWKPEDEGALAVCAYAEVELDQMADVLGRPPSNLVYRARDLGLFMPPKWRAILPKYVPAKKPQSRRPLEILSYPYLPTARKEHADLIRVNALVPKGFSSEMRADICQSILLSILEGEITIQDVEKNKDKLNWFIKKWRAEQSPWQEQSLADEDGKRSYDEIAAARGADKEFARENEMGEHRRIRRAMLKTHTEPTQIDQIYHSEVTNTGAFAHATGNYASREEVEGAIEDGDWDGPIATFATRRFFSHAIDRAKERYGVDLTYNDLRTISRFCQTRVPVRQDAQRDFHTIRWRGTTMRLVLDSASGHVVTFLPPKIRPAP